MCWEPLLYSCYILWMSFGVISEKFHIIALWSNGTQGCYNDCRPETLSKSWKKLMSLWRSVFHDYVVLYFIGIISIIIMLTLPDFSYFKNTRWQRWFWFDYLSIYNMPKPQLPVGYFSLIVTHLRIPLLKKLIINKNNDSNGWSIGYVSIYAAPAFICLHGYWYCVIAAYKQSLE